MNDIAPLDKTDALPVSTGDPMIDLIGKAMMQPDVPIDRINAMMDMRERQMDKEAEQSFNQAFAAAMAEMPDVPKGGKNKHSGQAYSTLDDLIRTVRPVLSRHGLSLNWQTDIDDAGLIHTTAIVRHAQGHSIQTTLKGARDSGKQMNNLQGGGSTETYLKRYTGFSILGLSSGEEIDDDGQSSGVATMVSAEQFVALRDKLELAGVAAETVCLAHGCQSLEQFPANGFASAMVRLDKNIAAKADE